jgi:hypothetical protein
MPSDPIICPTLLTGVVNNFVGVIAGPGTDTVAEGLIVVIVGSGIGLAGSSIKDGVISSLAGAVGASGVITASSMVGVTIGNMTASLVCSCSLGMTSTLSDLLD